MHLSVTQVRVPSACDPRSVSFGEALLQITTGVFLTVSNREKPPGPTQCVFLGVIEPSVRLGP